LQDRWLVLMMLICSWFNVHKDVTNYFNWDPSGLLCYNGEASRVCINY
jgi:hypothetical protein